MFRKYYSKFLSLNVRLWSYVARSHRNKLLMSIERAHLKELYKLTGQDYRKYLQDYTPVCDYFNFSICNENKYVKENGFIIDEKGIPKVLRNGEYVYNIVVICQYALLIYGQHLRGIKSKEEFLYYADIICQFQSKDGGYYYYYNFPYYLNPDCFTESGWTGAMQHGHVLSVMARAYSLSDNEKYSKCADMVLEFMNLDIRNGGVKGNIKSLEMGFDGVFYEEYPVIPESFTLNGYIFTLLGLYDWANVCKSISANDAMNKFLTGIETLKKVIHLYDFYGASCYDLGHITYGKKKRHYFPDYHAIHITQCLILYKLTGEKIFKEYAEKWKGLIE